MLVVEDGSSQLPALANMSAALSPCHDRLLALWNHKLRSVLREVAFVMGSYHSNRHVNNAGISCLVYSLIFIEKYFYITHYVYNMAL